MIGNCRSFLGNETRIVEGQRYTANKDERRTTSDDTGIVTVYRLTKNRVMERFRVMKFGFSRMVALLMLTPLLVMATKYAGEFQELLVGGRACAMGGVGVAQFADPSVIYFNPAGSYFTDRSVLLMHAENFGGLVKNEFGSIILPKENMTFGAGMQYISVDDIKLTRLEDTSSGPSGDNPLIPYDTVGTKDMVFYINAAKGNPMFSYGANIKIFYRNLAVVTGYGGGVDLGVMLDKEIFRVGFAVRDFILSPLMWSNGTKETIMPKFSLGIASVITLERMNSVIIFEHDFIKQLDVNNFSFNLGCEYSYKNLIFGRLGIYEGNYTLGVGLQYKRFKLDYALITHHELENSNKFSAGLQF
jgi:hypothetical protein